MHLNDVLQSSHIRLAGIVLSIVFGTYVAAGWIAFHAVHAGLEDRVRSAARLTALELQDVFEASGEHALTRAVAARTEVANPDDVVLWLGDGGGERLAGQMLASANGLRTGDYAGGTIGRDPGDHYFLLSRPIGGLHLIVGQSYEESDALSETILGIFITATILAALFSGLTALLLARRAKRRIDLIDGTLRSVADGNLDCRIAVAGKADDLSLLSTKINSALERLSTTVEAIRQVSVDIAHDLRTPISRLRIHLESLRGTLETRPELVEKVNASLEEACCITRTFDALLRISQIESGARRARFQPLTPAEIATWLKDAYEAVTEDAGQSLELRLAEGAGSYRILGDRDLLRQLFANLIENAIRHAGAGAHIRIGVDESARGVNMSVTDDGPGIPAEERQRVLDRFYRLDKSRTSEGSGLGLSLAQAIANLHSTELRLSDAAPGLKVGVDFALAAGVHATEGG